MKYLIVLILFGLSWNNVFARYAPLERTYIQQRLDAVKDRQQRLESQIFENQRNKYEYHDFYKAMKPDINDPYVDFPLDNNSKLDVIPNSSEYVLIWS